MSKQQPGPFRLPRGGAIDRNHQVHFRFDGKHYIGFAGDTLASALLANGVRITGRGLKTHRPRGIVTAGPEEPGSFVQFRSGHRGSPSVQATELRIQEGLEAKSINCWPNAKRDAFAIAGLFSRFFSAGFYYKTFMWPRWRTFRPLIRRMAGFGILPNSGDKNVYEQRAIHCDVLVIGSGLAGLCSARSAASAGAHTILVERDTDIGGSLLWEKLDIDSEPALAWVDEVESYLNRCKNAQVLTSAGADICYHDNLVSVIERPESDSVTARRWHIRARQVICATGATERPLVFPGNDRPGTMLASAVRHYTNRFAVSPGSRAVIFCNNDSAYQTALDLHEAGVSTVAVVDVRKSPGGELPKLVRSVGIEIIDESAITRVIGSSVVKGVEIRAIENRSKSGSRRINCDLIAVSGGWSPNIHLFSQSVGRAEFDETTQCFKPCTKLPHLISVGACDGEFNVWDTPELAINATVNALRNLGLEAKPVEAPRMIQKTVEPIAPFWRTPPHLHGVTKGKQFVDLLHEVQVSDIELAGREHYNSIELFKRYTTTGMAIDQGKTGNVNAIAILGEATDRLPGEVGTTTFRPPYTPVELGTLAAPRCDENGHGLYMPPKHLPLHDWHIEQGAVMEDYGEWQRPAYYTKDHADEAQAIRREVLNTRTNVSILDYSSLSKIEVKGPHAVEFTNRVFANNMATLKLGRCRYGLVLNENGTVVDDGVVARLTDDRMLITTTSAGASHMAEWVDELRQAIWPKMEVAVSFQTTDWATISLTGPRARKVIEQLESNIDFGSDDFPHMSIRTGQISGIACRILRVSFTGELGYEINVPWGSARQLWEELLTVGRTHGIAPLGLEALDVMRTEKGYIHVGMDTDSVTIPNDVGWGVPVDKKKGEFIGKRSLQRLEQRRSEREELVGLRTLDAKKALPFGSQIVSPDRDRSEMLMMGHVTSSYFSPTLDQPIALAVLTNGRNRHGEIVTLFNRGELQKAKVVAPVFYDAEGDRLNA